MHPDYRTRETIRDRLIRDFSAIRTLLADPQYGGQVLDRLPSGEYAWLRPEYHPVRVVEPVTLPCPDDDARYDLTELGRRALAMERLFGPWPHVVDSVCCGCGAILRPGVNIHYRTPDGRTHCDGCATAGDVEYQPTTPPAEVPAA